MRWYLHVLSKYCIFTGRAGRSEFWWFTLVNTLVFIVLLLLGEILGVGAALLMLYALAVFLPDLGLKVRRFHDSGHSGWWILIGLVPFVGFFIVFIVLGFLPSKAKPNRYGPVPVEVGEL